VLGEELYLGVHDDLLEFSDPWLLLFLRILRYLSTRINNGGQLPDAKLPKLIKSAAVYIANVSEEEAVSLSCRSHHHFEVAQGFDSCRFRNAFAVSAAKTELAHVIPPPSIYRPIYGAG
jgi:hypothetical protein